MSQMLRRRGLFGFICSGWLSLIIQQPTADRFTEHPSIVTLCARQWVSAMCATWIPNWALYDAPLKEMNEQQLNQIYLRAIYSDNWAPIAIIVPWIKWFTSHSSWKRLLFASDCLSKTGPPYVGFRVQWLFSDACIKHSGISISTVQ